MADFPVPIQDVTGDDKQGMIRMSVLPLGTFCLCFFVYFSWNAYVSLSTSGAYEDHSQYMNTLGWIK